MQHLCLGIDVDTEWQTIPRAIRKAVLARVTGDKFEMTTAMHEWMVSRSKDIESENLNLRICLETYQLANQRLKNTTTELLSSSTSSSLTLEPKATMQCNNICKKRGISFWMLRGPQGIIRYIASASKWVAILSGAASEVERELWFSIQGTLCGDVILWLLLGFWKICQWVKNLLIIFILIYRRPELSNILRLCLKGSSRALVEDNIRVEFPQKTETGFITEVEGETAIIEIFDGSFEQRPVCLNPVATVLYQDLRLQTRQDELTNGKRVSQYHYANQKNRRWPLYKHVIEPNRTMKHRYDKFGRVVSGNITFHQMAVEFDFRYRKAPRHSCDILRAHYRLVHDFPRSLSVYWGVFREGNSEDSNATASLERVTRVVKKIGNQKYITSIVYQHKRDPRSSTVLKDGDRTISVEEAPKIFDQEEAFLVKPPNLSFDADDLLIHHPRDRVKRMFRGAATVNPSFIAKFANKALAFLPFDLSYSSRSVVHQRVSTTRLRGELWKLWIDSSALDAVTLDAVTACWLDEIILRNEPLLRKYWRMRDLGRLHQAKTSLDEHIEEIVAAIEIPFSISKCCSLPIKPADLYTMGLGKDATQITNRPDDCFQDTNDRISIIFNDIGCWPNAPGGVSNCRRDLVNGHKTIRNHVLAEAANDYGIPRFQMETNVQSLKVLPLWGLDFKTAQHGLIDNLLQSQVDRKIVNTDTATDIVKVFIPMLECFVRVARMKRPSKIDLIKCSNTMLSMSAYFEQKDYNMTWSAKEVEVAWIQAWLYPYNDPNIRDSAELFDIERPSMDDFKIALDLYMSNFLIYSIQTPEECPRVFQSTHHGISSLFGMILKYRRGTTFGIWDHAILWRECCLNISPTQCRLPLAVQSMLLASIGLAARLAYLHVDVVLPCTAVYNPCVHPILSNLLKTVANELRTWEADIGTDQGRLGSKKKFFRKIDPIANGINDIASFEPVECRSRTPTVVMLSNVQFIKDIKTAVLAADVIVNEYGFKDYSLLIYGAQDRQPLYTMEIYQLISDRNLTDHISLAGFGDPKEVLKDAWLFMNSSLSEGFPLAIGEAALTGVPIVATEVGGTALLLTDPDEKSCKYGEVVPPNDSVALARAQLNLLAMVGHWAKYTSDVEPTSILPDVMTPRDVEWITKRMYEKSDDRHQLGLRCRGVVLRSFHGGRYLREHEQMYWIQWHRSQMRTDEELDAQARWSFPFGESQELCYNRDGTYRRDVKTSDEEDKDVGSVVSNFRWRDFRKETRKQKSQRRKIEGECQCASCFMVANIISV
jgi:glycosyltransferase involved in cell wall biosynthesis